MFLHCPFSGKFPRFCWQRNGVRWLWENKKPNQFYFRIGGHDEAEGLVPLSSNVISIFDPRFQLLLSFIKKISHQRKNLRLWCVWCYFPKWGLTSEKDVQVHFKRFLSIWFLTTFTSPITRNAAPLKHLHISFATCSRHFRKAKECNMSLLICTPEQKETKTVTRGVWAVTLKRRSFVNIRKSFKTRNYFAFIFLSFSFIVLCSWYHPWQNFPICFLSAFWVFPFPYSKMGKVCKLQNIRCRLIFYIII